ncbi:hypothetical protein [Streptomyces sp. NRRL S-350]|uniref:hypothetical protein n=1 Tax=Streptomyces sp. NRRL S-350 TaxID=1463902 RepID=UPI0004C21398|nr:hypothetical protein [Streptomyces sp. NRRL S-350]
MEQRGWAYERALEIAAVDARAEVVDTVATALEVLGGASPDEVPLGRLLWHLAAGLRGRHRGEDGVDVLVDAVDAVALALGAERGAWGQDDVLLVTGGEYQGRAGLMEVPVWEPDDAARDVMPGLPHAYKIDLDRTGSLPVPTEHLRVATPTTDPGVFMDVAFPSVWVGCVVWGDRLVRWHAERRRSEWEPLDFGPDPADTVSRAALLLSAALLDAATTHGLDEPDDGTALLDLPLAAVSTLLAGDYDETIAGVLERTRPGLAVTDPLLDELRNLWGPHAGLEGILQRRRVQRLARAIVVGHQVAGQRRDLDPGRVPVGPGSRAAARPPGRPRPLGRGAARHRLGRGHRRSARGRCAVGAGLRRPTACASPCRGGARPPLDGMFAAEKSQVKPLSSTDPRA